MGEKKINDFIDKLHFKTSSHLMEKLKNKFLDVDEKDYSVSKNFNHLQTFDISHDSVGLVMFNDFCHALCMNHELELFRWLGNQLGDLSSFIDLVKSAPTFAKIAKEDFI